MAPPNFQSLSNFIWSVADLLRGPYRPPQYERVMLPMTVLRRFDCVLEHSKKQIIAKHEAMVAKNKTLPEGKRINDFDPTLNKIAKDIDGRELGFHNHSPLNFQKLKGDPDNIGRHLQDYINGFSENIREIFDKFEFDKEIEKMEESNRLYLVVSKFAEIDLHPDRVLNITMGLVFEDLIRRFNESANETAGDHFTPREVIRLMVNLLMEPDDDMLTQGSPIVTICDPACGTGGMLSEAQNWIREHNEDAIVQGLSARTTTRAPTPWPRPTCLSRATRTAASEFGNTLTDDTFRRLDGFDYLLANPPFGVDWKAQQKRTSDKWQVQFPRLRGQAAARERRRAALPAAHDVQAAGLRRSPDPAGQARLPHRHCLQRLAPLHRRRRLRRERHPPLDHRERLAGGHRRPAGADVLQHRHRHLHLDRHQPEEKKRKGKIQLIDCRERYRPMRRSLGDKRRYLDQETIDTLSREHGGFKESETSKIFDNIHFGYRRITVERPLRLRFQITDEAKEQFLNTCPELFDAVEAMRKPSAPSRTSTGTPRGRKCCASSRTAKSVGMQDRKERAKRSSSATASRKLIPRPCQLSPSAGASLALSAKENFQVKN